MSPHRTSRPLTAIRVLLGLVAAAALLGAGSARAGSAGATPALGGYQGRALASGLHVFYNPEGLLPTAPPIDFGAPDALATITSGPATFARAAVFDPGDLLANPDALLSQADPRYPEGTIPEYPYRVSATTGVGEPSAESTPAPGLRAHVLAEPAGSSAEATMPALATPAITTVASMSSLATTATDGSSVTTHARTEISGFDLLGVVKIDTIVTDLAASSDGTATALTGGTTLTGASVLGQPVTIDADGIHATAEPHGKSPILGRVTSLLTGNLNDLLGNAGIRLTLAGPVEQAGDSSGRLASTGLRVDIELSDKTVAALKVLAGVINALPPLPNPIPGAPSLEDVLAAAQARHLVALDLGRGVVSLTARPAVPASPPAPPAAQSGQRPTGSSSAGTPPTAASPVRPGSPVAAAPSVAPSAPVLATEVPATSVGAGIGALAILVLLTQPFVGDRLARAATALLSADATGTCPREER